MKELKSLQELVKEMEGLLAVREDILVLIEMAYEENDDSMVKEIQSEIQGFETQFEELRTRTLLSGEYDGCNAIVTIHAGPAGRSPATGPGCCTGCTHAGQSGKDFPSRCWISWTGISPASRA